MKSKAKRREKIGKNQIFMKCFILFFMRFVLLNSQTTILKKRKKSVGTRSRFKSLICLINIFFKVHG